MPGSFHVDQRVGRRTELSQQLLIARGVLAERGGPVENRAALVDTGDRVAFCPDVDPDEAHTRPFRRESREPSGPASMLVLVHARPSATPRDTVRALDTGRGRRSQTRGLSLMRPVATLSRIPSGAIYPGSAR